MSQNISAHPAAPIAFLTDFGSVDGDVAVMKGVVLNLVPGLTLIDVSHEIAPQDISSAAWVLASSYRYFPRQTIFVCVVDPGVGSQRLPIALHAGEWFFVGPNNGLFSYILGEQPVHETVALTNPIYHLAHVSATFHGRDIFSPVAAHIANGTALTDLGQAVQPSALQQLDIAPTLSHDGHISAQIVHVDHFGNLITNIPASMLPDFFAYARVQLQFSRTGSIIGARRRFFSDTTSEPGDDPFLYIDSSGYIGVALQNGNAASLLQISTHEHVAFTHA